MKRLIVILFIFVLLAGFQFFLPTKIYAEKGEIIDMESTDITSLALTVDEIEGRPMVSLRQMGKNYNWNFEYLPEEKKVAVRSGEKDVEIPLAENRYGDKRMEAAPEIKEGRTFVGLDFINPLMQDLEDIKVHLLVSLRTDRKRAKPGDELTAIIELYNISEDTIRLHYPSGQLYDLCLCRDDSEVWRWSDDKFFTMALQFKDLEAGDRLYYREKVPIKEGLSAGSYILGGEIATESSLPLPRVEIEVVK